jgi:hypothetical protein
VSKPLIVLAAALVAASPGCDWFSGPVSENLAPDTTLLECASETSVTEGEDAEFRWEGEDVDGLVAGYEYSYDDGPWVSTAERAVVIEGISLGIHTFRVRSVDDGGAADPTPAFCEFSAGKAPRQVDRNLLVEVFTTNTCKNCPTSEEALNQLLGEVGPGRLCVVAYHDLPASDGLATAATEARIDWYTDRPAFPGEADLWPTAVFDGLRVVEGASSVAKALGDYRLETDARLASGSPLSLVITGDIGESAGSFNARVKVEGLLPESQLLLRAVVIEDGVSYNGWFAKSFDFVARVLLPPQEVTERDVGDSVAFDLGFDVDEGWDPGNMDVIVFVQDTQTMEILQAGRLGE